MSGRSPTADSDAVSAGEASEAPQKATKTARRRRWPRILLVTALAVVLLGAAGVAAAGLYVRSVESGIERVDAFTGVPDEARPTKVKKDALNILILGSDSRDPENTSGSRADTIILAHLPSDRSSAQLISIPRDTWVHVPKAKNGTGGGRDAKINASFAWGGLPLMVQTVEQYTRVRVDHVALVDFAGFKEIIDALGGVDVDVDRTFTSTHSLDKPHHFVKGRRHMDGVTALDYSRERYAFPDGDFTRIRHQQQVIKAILDKAASGGLLASPAKLNSFVRATTDAVAIDKSLPLLDMAMELRHLRSDNLVFLTSPSKGTGRIGSQSVVFADTKKARVLFDAVRRDSVAEIVTAAK